MKPGLLDVNVLISLIDPAHEFHDPAHVWFQRNRKYGWATCPITENGCVRVVSKSAYPNGGITPSQVREVLAVFGTADDHLFWPDALTLLDSGLFNLTEAGPKISPMPICWAWRTFAEEDWLRSTARSAPNGSLAPVIPSLNWYYVTPPCLRHRPGAGLDHGLSQ